MVMRDFPALERTLLDISNPHSANYGKWLTKAQADALTATPEPIAKEVFDWATSTGATCTRHPESWKCEGSVASIEQLLDAKLDYWQHKTDKSAPKLIRTSMAKPGAVPASLEGKVTVLTGLTQFPMGQRAGTARPAGYTKAAGGLRGKAGDTDYSVVPETLRILYNATDSGSAASSVGPIEFQNYPAVIQTDLDTFATNTGLKKWTITPAHTVGPFTPGAGAESALDEQYVVAMSPESTQWYWTEVRSGYMLTERME
jgi:tripeptidyl-peptidase-1